MFKLLTSIILIALAIAGVFMVADPLYKDITALKLQEVKYNEALDNSKALENERDKLTKKYNSILPENLTKIEKLLPDNVDNIRLILEIEKIALPYGMTLKEVVYDSTSKEDAKKTGGAMPGGEANQASRKDYGDWVLGFTTQTTYGNFLNFVKDLESNLRIVDISSIEFLSNAGGGLNPTLAESYKYDFKIKTYWLKN